MCHFCIIHWFQISGRKKTKDKYEGTNIRGLVDTVFVRCANVQRCSYPAALRFLVTPPGMIFDQPQSPCQSAQKCISHLETLIWDSCWYISDGSFLFCTFSLSKCSLKFDADSNLLGEPLFLHPVLSGLGFLRELHQSSIDSLKGNVEERQVLMQELYHIFYLVIMTYFNLFRGNLDILIIMLHF